MKSLQEYLEENKKECIDNNIDFESLVSFFTNEWTDNLYNHLKSGNTISQEAYDSLTDSQKWYLNKHYLIHGIKIVA